MGFFIECTIVEIEIKNNEYILKIRGTDGYVLSKNSRTYNVFFPEDLGKSKNLPEIIESSAMVLDVESLVFLKGQQCCFFPLSQPFNCKVKIKFKSCKYINACKAYELEEGEIIFING